MCWIMLNFVWTPSCKYVICIPFILFCLCPLLVYCIKNDKKLKREDRGNHPVMLEYAGWFLMSCSDHTMTEALLLFFMLTVTKITIYMLKSNNLYFFVHNKVIHKLCQLTPYAVTTHPVYGVSCYKNYLH